MIEEGGGASLTTDPAAGSSAPTDVSLREYVELNWRWQERFLNERDRRYAEVAAEKEKALKIKETADETARILVAENQAYKDEKANELREQIGNERGLYATKEELKPIVAYVSGEQGNRRGVGTSASVAYGVIVLVIMAATFILYKKPSTTPAPAVVCTASYHPAPSCPTP